MGNSLIVVWPRDHVDMLVGSQGVIDEAVRRDRLEEDSHVMVARKAVQCALEIKIESKRLLGDG
jgi:hypothetical protein